MLMVLIMAAVLWGIGIGTGVPKQTRWKMLALLLVVVLVIQLALPDGHALREVTGKDPRLWIMVVAGGGLVWLYRRGLGALRRKAGQGVSVVHPRDTAKFSEVELDRYARHIMLRELGGPGQRALRDAKVLIVGAGGLGSPAVQYLAAAGVGTLGVIDDDVVENANLQRQVIHTDGRIGMAKVYSASEAVAAQNPFVTVKPYHRRLDAAIAADLFADYDLILDGTDNFATRYLVNATAVALGKPLISAALTQWEGQISLFDPVNGAPCYACVFPTAPDPALVPSCAQAGVIGPLPGVIGAMMAVEAVKLIAGAGDLLRGRLLIYDALFAQTRIIRVKRRETCAVCGASQNRA